MHSTAPSVMLTMPQNATQTKEERILKLFPSNVARALSIVQLVCAAVAAILQVHTVNPRLEVDL
jgi:hypothetical protein